MEKIRQNKKKIVLCILIFACLFALRELWSVIPDYSVNGITVPEYAEADLNTCRVNQADPFHLYESFLEAPETLSETELQKITDIISLLESYGAANEEDMKYILGVSNATGCGFAILTEIIYDLYKDRPDDFEKKYGYALYSEQDGEIEYNSEVLFTDIFLRMNKDKIQEIIDDDNDYRYLFTMVGAPLFDTDVRVNKMEKYVADVIGNNTKTVTVQRDLSYKTYNTYMVRDKYDYVFIAVHKYKLLPYGSNPRDKAYASNGGHWMRILGVNKGKHFIVSTWGSEWELVESSPYVEDKKFLHQPLNDNDGGLVFIRINDRTGG